MSLCLHVCCKCNPRCIIVITQLISHRQWKWLMALMWVCGIEDVEAGGRLTASFFPCVFSGWRGVRRRRVHCERRLHPLRPDGEAGLLRHRHGPAQTGKQKRCIWDQNRNGNLNDPSGGSWFITAATKRIKDGKMTSSQENLHLKSLYFVLNSTVCPLYYVQ